MPESQETTANAGELNTDQGTESAKAFEAITSQDDFDKAIQTRIARERAKIPTDYDELKAQAAKYADWEESQKTESQKANDRAEVAEKRAAELETRTTRAEVAEAKSDPAKGIIIPASMLTGSTQEELEASADALIAFKGIQPEAAQSKQYIIPDEGGVPALGKADNITPGMGTLRAAYSQEKV